MVFSSANAVEVHNMTKPEFEPGTALALGALTAELPGGDTTQQLIHVW